MVQTPGSMSLRGLRLIIGNEGRRSHGGSLALAARFTRRLQQASPLVKNLISIRSRSRCRGRSESSTPLSWRSASGVAQSISRHRRVGPDTPVGIGSWAVWPSRSGPTILTSRSSARGTRR